MSKLVEELPETSCKTCGSARDCEHSQFKLEFRKPLPVKLRGTLRRLEDRIGTMKKERVRILTQFEAERKDRLETARSIARAMSKAKGQVTVHEVHDAFVQQVKHLRWEDDNGKTYWAGAIFRQRGWECIGRCESPYNHNDQNKVWRWTGV